LTTIAQRYKNYTNIYGIEMVNEPRYDTNKLKDFYNKTYFALREVVPDWNIVMHDGFNSRGWVGFMNSSDYTNI